MRASTGSSPLLWLAACYGLSCVTVSASLIRRSPHAIEYRSLLLPRAISVDGNCGAKAGTTCLGSEFGDCCGQRGYCGGTNVYCGDGCQSDYGTCGDSSISTDGSCGGSKGLTCLGSLEGDCCSAKGFCGKTSVYCGDGCQSGFGTCGSSQDSDDDDDAAPSATAKPKTSPAASPTTKSKASSTADSATKSTPSDDESTDDNTTTSSTSKSKSSDDDASTSSNTESTGSGDGPNASSTGVSTDTSAEEGQEEADAKDDDGGISAGAKIGMGVGIPVAAILIGALGLWLFFRRRRYGAVGTSAKDPQDEDAADAADAADEARGGNTGPDGNGAMAAKNEPQAQVPLIILIVGGIGSRIQVWGRRLGAGGEEYTIDEDKRGGGRWKNRRVTPMAELGGTELPAELAARK